MSDELLNREIIDALVNEMKPRTNARVDPVEAELLPLGESLKRAQYHPVILDADYVIIDGWRRWLAARLVGLTTLKAIITARPLTETELRIAQLSISVHRSGLTGWELYCTFYELLQLNPGWQAKDLAGHLKCDPSYVTRIMAVSKCGPEVRAALKKGLIGTAITYAISKEPEERQAELLAAALAGASRDEIEREGRRKRNGTVPAVRTDRIRFLTPRGIVTVSGESLSFDDVIEMFLGLVKKARSAVAKSIDIREWEREMRKARRTTAKKRIVEVTSG